MIKVVGFHFQTYRVPVVFALFDIWRLGIPIVTNLDGIVCVFIQCSTVSKALNAINDLSGTRSLSLTFNQSWHGEQVSADTYVKMGILLAIA